MILRILSYISGALAIMLMIYYFWVYDRTTREVLQVLWVESPYATDLRNILDEFTDETNISVHVESVPRELYRELVTRELDNGTADFDIVIGDTSWMSKDIQQGYYADISKYAINSWLYSEMSNPLRFSFLEYPHKSGVYYGMPVALNGFAMAYRKDLFTDPVHIKRFEDVYGYPLAVPTSLDQLSDVAQYFYDSQRVAEGITLMNTGRKGDVSNTFFALFTAQGGDIDGLLNEQKIASTSLSAQTLNTLKEINAYSVELDADTSPYRSSYSAFANGGAPILIGTFEMVRELYVDAEKLDFSLTPDQIGYAPIPGTSERKGFLRMYSAAKVANTSRSRAANMLIQWLGTQGAHKLWREEGGFPLVGALIAHPDTGTPPYFSAFIDSVKRPQYLPIYSDTELYLQTSDTYISGFLNGRGDFDAHEILTIIRDKRIEVR